MKSLAHTSFLGVIGLIVASGLPHAAMGGSTIYACAHKNLGDIRVVSAPGQCLKSEYELSWEDGLELRQEINSLLGRMSAIEAALGVLNEAPTVVATDDQTILVSLGATLDAVATDDGILRPLTYQWQELSGSSSVQILNPYSLITNVSFSAPGEYEFRLTVDDGLIEVSDELRVVVYPDNEPPVITKATDPLVIPAYRIEQNGYWTLYCPDIDLQVTVEDDGLPQTMSFGWNVDVFGMQPPNIYSRASVGFTSDPSNSVDWPLQMAAIALDPLYPKSYLPEMVIAWLSLGVTDGYHSVEETLQVRCDVSASPAPVVNAGNDLTRVGEPVGTGSAFQCEFPIAATVEDDGRPEPVRTEWGITDISPSASIRVVGFPGGLAGTATLQVRESIPGVTFTVRLRASDGYNTTDDYIDLTCMQP